MKYYENINGSEKHQIKDNSFCRGKCEKKNGIEEVYFYHIYNFFPFKKSWSSKIEGKILSLTKLSGGTRMFVVLFSIPFGMLQLLQNLIKEKSKEFK